MCVLQNTYVTLIEQLKIVKICTWSLFPLLYLHAKIPCDIRLSI